MPPEHTSTMVLPSHQSLLELQHILLTLQTCKITPRLMQVRYALRTRGVHVQSACLTCRSHKEKSTRFESSKWNFSNSSEATCLKRLCRDANQLAISRNDSVVQDGTFVGVRLLFSWSRACFVARFMPFLHERH